MSGNQDPAPDLAGRPELRLTLRLLCGPDIRETALLTFSALRVHRGDDCPQIPAQ
jgi:hypothetical protein